MASDPQLLIDMADYWTAYDALATEEDRAALQRDFLLAHGGVIVEDPPFTMVKGGLFPVRV